MKTALAVLLLLASLSLVRAIEAERLRLLYRSEGSLEGAMLPPNPAAVEVLSELRPVEQQPHSDAIFLPTLNPGVSDHLLRRNADDRTKLLPEWKRDHLDRFTANGGSQASVYTADLSIGSVNLVGLIGDNYTLQGLTVIPEPSTATLVVGFAALLWLKRHRAA